MKIRPEAVISLQFLLQWSEISQLSAPSLCLHALLCVCVRVCENRPVQPCSSRQRSKLSRPQRKHSSTQPPLQPPCLDR